MEAETVIVKFKEKEYQLPESINHIPIGQFQQIMLLQDRELDEFAYSMNVIAIISGIPLEEITEIDVESYNSLAEYLTRILLQSFETHLPEKIFIEGIEYRFDIDLDKMSLAEYLDLDILSTKYKYWDVAHKILACLIRPVDETGKIEKYEAESRKEREKMFYNSLPLGIVNPIKVFFSVFGIELLKMNSANYSEILLMKRKLQIKDNINQEKSFSQINGDGTKS